MTDDVRNIVLGVIAAGVSAALGWLARTYLWRRELRRKQDFFGLPSHSECLLVVNRDPGTDGSVHRHDVFALLELSALIKDCDAHAQILSHDAARQGFGERTEYCVGGPGSNRRAAAHLQALLPGIRVNTDREPGPDRASFSIGTEHYPLVKGVLEHVLLARLSIGADARPVFLLCGQRAIDNQAAARYLTRNWRKLARTHRGSTFCLLLKVVNSDAYGPDVVELVADVTRIARTPVPAALPDAEHATG
ncbi:hypothetical protein [Streptomyces sp. AM 2-1-1]|uniref:hypothetical protein n=1 Tax=unclassified Streptomyces TaxID=2593676 RepID=UPI0023B95B2F|nr:hypothetical protein [Streptomyces sp. AM 2-1-1]WEH38814.1 hypothetical protein PZB77_04420 [Streptomyces sp. AM 2-1-1]